MAYISQDEKKVIAVNVKNILKKYELKGSLSVRHHSTLVLTIKSGKLDFIAAANKRNKEIAERMGREFYEVKDSYDVNTYHIDSTYKGKIKNCLNELHAAMRGEGWFDHSDSMIDYFHVKHYTDIKIGRWDKAYELTK